MALKSGMGVDDPAALEIKGDEVTGFDGAAEHKLGFVLTPCLATFEEKSDGPGGMAMTTKLDKQFVIVDG